jgi:hypothetical protein
MYITSSRALAKTIKKGHKKTISSTGGPNTLVATKLTPGIREAIRFSATIENSGQCTALRHVVVPVTSKDEALHMFDGIPIVSTPADALKAGQFAGIFDFVTTEGIPSNYEKHPDSEAYVRIDESLPPDDIDEYWRRVVVDVTTSLNVDELANWLVRNQPISLAVNGEMSLARELFEKTGLVVYTVGTENNPALTCQARPQEGEVFGEFPPRRDLQQYTEYPVIVPSATAAYNSFYNTSYLENLDTSKLMAPVQYISDLLDAAESKEVCGYCVEIANYLVDAAGPNEAHAARSVLWGIQRPPINGQMTILRCSKTNSLSDALPTMIPFLISNARDQLSVSVHPENTELIQKLESLGGGRISMIQEDDGSFLKRTDRKEGEDVYNVVHADAMLSYPMPAQFVSSLFPFGHIKSTEPHNTDFINYFKDSAKWLKMMES